jgi:DNA-binding transcriptional LysR family regulator
MGLITNPDDGESGMKHEVGTLGRRVDLNLMVIFEAVYRTRNLTEAGQRLGLSQPAVSHALSRLRLTFRDPLFVRTPRGVVPTPVADGVAPAVAEGLAIIRGSFDQEPFDPSTSGRLFTIGMADIGEFVQLPLVIKALCDAPGVRLRTLGLSPAQARTALGEGHLDIALSNFPVRAPLHEELLGKPGYATVVAKDHPFIRTKLTLALFRKARHLLVKPVSAGVKHGEAIEKALLARGVEANIAVQVAHFHPVGVIVSQSDLIATVPWGVAKTMMRMVPLKAFRPPIELPTTHLSLCWHERYHRDPGNIWLREIFLRETRALYVEYK